MSCMIPIYDIWEKADCRGGKKKSVVAGVQRARERGAWVGRSVILGVGCSYSV